MKVTFSSPFGSLLWFIVAAAGLLTQPVTSQPQQPATIYQALQSNPKLSQFFTLVKSTLAAQHLNMASSSSQNTVFAPVDQTPSLTQESNPDLIKYYQLEGLLLDFSSWLTVGKQMDLKDIKFGRGVQIDTRGRLNLLRLSKMGDLYLVNMRRCDPNPVSTNNGRLFTLDAPLPIKYAKYSSKKLNEFITDQASEFSMTKTANLLAKLQGDFLFTRMKIDTHFSTIFIVTDDGWRGIPASVYDNLLNDNAKLEQFFANHLSQQQMVYHEWTAYVNQIDFTVGQASDPPSEKSASLRKIGTQTKVIMDRTSANVLRGSMDIDNGVVIFIDRPLGFVFETKLEALNRVQGSMFLRLCQAHANCSALLDSAGQDTTILAPSDSAMYQLQNKPDDVQWSYLQFLILPEALPVESMSETRVLNRLGLSDAIRFKSVGLEMVQVEARQPGRGYTKANIRIANVATTDGPIIHAIDSIPGLATQPVRAFLQAQGSFGLFLGYDFLEKALKLGGRYTCLYPTDAALTKAQADTEVGAKILANDQLRAYVLRRHCFPMALILEDLSVNLRYRVPTANYAFTREMLNVTTEGKIYDKNGIISFEDQPALQISSKLGSYEALNGWIYQTDQLLYNAADLQRNLCTSQGCKG